MENWASVVKFRIPSYFVHVTSIVKYFQKVTLKVSTAFYILRNWGKFENTACWPPSNGEIGGK